jgi:hypothetical protein
LSKPKPKPVEAASDLKWRVVYGETLPAWEKLFPTRAEARAFAREHKAMGDLIFDIKRVEPGEPPQSLMAAIAADQDVDIKMRNKKPR